MFNNMNLLTLLIRLPAIIAAFSFHEFSHGLAAYFLGDKTAKLDGRLSLNPIRHIDPVGILLLLFLGFGWAKPVHVNTAHFKDPKQDMAITAFAGPLSNFLLAFIAVLIYFPLVYILYQTPGDQMNQAHIVLYYILLFVDELIRINIVLGIFNMLPIPPLDGSKVFGAILPNNLYFQFISFGNYGVILLILVLWTGFGSNLIVSLQTFIYYLFLTLGEKIYFFL